MRNFEDKFCACKRVPTLFKKPCSPVFLNNYKQNKMKNFLHTFLDIPKETAYEKNLRIVTLLELVLLEVFISLDNQPNFWKSLSKVAYIISHWRTCIVI